MTWTVCALGDLAVQRRRRPGLGADPDDAVGVEVGRGDAGRADQAVVGERKGWDVLRLQAPPGDGSDTGGERDIGAEGDPQQRRRLAGRSHREKPDRGDHAGDPGCRVAVRADVETKDRSDHYEGRAKNLRRTT